MARLKYSFKKFIPNGIGADVIRICRLYCYCKSKGIDLYMDEDDKWMITNDGNWRTLFNSLNMTKEDMPLVTKEIMKDAVSYSEYVTYVRFNEMVECVNDVYVPNDKYKVEMQSDDKYAVVHVRRGDKVEGLWKEGIYHELDEYLEQLEYKNEDIFVMSDSPDVAEEAKSKGCMIDENEQRRDGYVYKMYYGSDHRNTKVNPMKEYMEHSYTDDDIEDELNIFFKNMEIFRGATHLVGSNSSFYYVLGQLLNGKKGVSLSNNYRYD